MKTLTIILFFCITTFAITEDSLLTDITEVANLNSDEVQAIPISNNEFTEVTGYHTEWMDLDINFKEILEAKMQYCLVFNEVSKSFSLHFAYTGRDWSQLDLVIFKLYDQTIVKEIKVGKRKVLTIGHRLRQYFSTDWFGLSDFLYKFIATGSVMINFTGLKWNLTTNVLPQTHKILLAKFYLKMMSN